MKRARVVCLDLGPIQAARNAFLGLLLRGKGHGLRQRIPVRPASTRSAVRVGVRRPGRRARRLGSLVRQDTLPDTGVSRFGWVRGLRARLDR